MQFALEGRAFLASGRRRHPDQYSDHDDPYPIEYMDSVKRALAVGDGPEMEDDGVYFLDPEREQRGYGDNAFVSTCLKAV